jgi:hypothetical protein
VAGVLFGEGQSRFLISFAKEAPLSLHELAVQHTVPLVSLGVVGGDRIRIEGALEVTLEHAGSVYATALS